MTYEQTVTPLPHIPHLRITACKGSIVGPPWSDPQLAYIFTFDADSQHPLSVYHEPHGVHDETFLAAYKGKLDAVIAPVVSTTLPVLANYSLVNGVPEAVRLCNLVRPRACLTFDNSGGEQSGFLTGFLSKAGGLDQFKSAVAELPQLRDMQIIPAGPLMHPVVIAAHPATTPVSHN